MSDDDPQWAAPGRPADPSRPVDAGQPGPPGPPSPPPDSGVAAPASQGSQQWTPSAAVFTPSMYAEYRPGIVPLRPLLVSDILSGVTTAIRGNPAATLGLGLVTTLIFVVPAALLGAWLASWANGQFGDRLPDGLTGSGLTAGSLFGALGSDLPQLASSAAVLLMTGFMAHVIGQGVIGRKTSLQQTWASTRSRLWSVVGSAVLLFLILVGTVALCLGAPVGILIASTSGSSDSGVGGGIFALVVGVVAMVVVVVVVSIRFGFAASAIVLEQLGPVAGLRRSWRLTSGQPFWRILGIRLLVGLMAGIGGGILSLPITFGLRFALEGATDSTNVIAVGTVFIAALASIVVGTLTTPFSAGASTLLYIDQRIRREALDVQLVRAAQSGA